MKKLNSCLLCLAFSLLSARANLAEFPSGTMDTSLIELRNGGSSDLFFNVKNCSPKGSFVVQYYKLSSNATKPFLIKLSDKVSQREFKQIGFNFYIKCDNEIFFCKGGDCIFYVKNGRIEVMTDAKVELFIKMTKSLSIVTVTTHKPTNTGTFDANSVTTHEPTIAPDVPK